MYQRVLQRDGRYAPAVHFGMGKSLSRRSTTTETAVGHLEKAAEATTMWLRPIVTHPGLL